MIVHLARRVKPLDLSSLGTGSNFFPQVEVEFIDPSEAFFVAEQAVRHENVEVLGFAVGYQAFLSLLALLEDRTSSMVDPAVARNRLRFQAMGNVISCFGGYPVYVDIKAEPMEVRAITGMRGVDLVLRSKLKEENGG